MKPELARSASVAPDTVPMEMRLELILIPVSDVERAKLFYAGLGWSLDIDFSSGGDYRVVQFTPPGSGCSIMFGAGITTAALGPVQGLHLIVPDLVSARNLLLGRGIDVGEPFHDEGGVFHHVDPAKLTLGVNPERKSYASYASFSDPDGNLWVLQEITARLSSELEAGDPRFTPQIVAWLTGT